MITKALFLLLCLSPLFSFEQIPSRQGLTEYSFLDRGDTVHFYIYHADSVKKTKIFLYIQGSGDLPMVNGDSSEACCWNNYPKKLMMTFPKEYAFVYIQKVGLPYYVRDINTYSVSQRFVERNNVLDRASVADKVVNYILKNIYPTVKVVAVLGHSEGSDVAARLAVINKKVSHLCFASGNGAPQLYNDILFIRKQMYDGVISAVDAQYKIEKLLSGLDSVYKNPSSSSSYFNGDTYKWNSAIDHPPIDNLLQLKIPIYLTIGSDDEKVPVASSDYIALEFIRHRKNNLMYKVYPNCNHAYIEQSNGGSRDHWIELFTDFLKFVDQH